MKSGSAAEVKLALVGLGHVAEHQVEAIEMIDGLRLVAGCDKDPRTAQRLSKGTAFFSNLEEMLSWKQFDIAMISTPNREHFHHGEMVVEAGKDLILEKPATENRRQLDGIVRNSENSGVFLYFSLHAAFGAEVTWYRQQLATGGRGLGDLRDFLARFYDPYIKRDVLAEGAVSLEGSWMDSGVNALSVLGMVSELSGFRVESSRMRVSNGLNCTETEARVSLSADNARGCIHTSWLMGQNHKSTRLVFDNAEVVLDHSQQQVSISREDDCATVFAYEGPLHRLTNHYTGVFSDLVARYASGRSNKDFAVAVHRLFFDADERRQLVG